MRNIILYHAFAVALLLSGAAVSASEREVEVSAPGLVRIATTGDGGFQVFDGDAPVTSRLDRLTPLRGELVWFASRPGKYRIVPAAASNESAPTPLIGDGDQLMLDTVSGNTALGTVCSSRLADGLFPDTVPAMVNGMSVNEIQIIRNLGAPGKFRFSRAQKYTVRNAAGEKLILPNPSASTKNLPLLRVEAVDFDGDGKCDLFVSDVFGTRPVFMRNLSAACDLIFADPVETETLFHRPHYAFGDLDGDGKIDALSVALGKSGLALAWHQGQGLSVSGVPEFAAAKELPLDISIPAEVLNNPNVRCASGSLADLDGDGKPDLSLMLPPYLYVAFNRGETRSDFSFSKAVQVADESGKPVMMDNWYPDFNWHDIDNDGVPDLLTRDGRTVRLARERVTTLKKPQKLNWYFSAPELRSIAFTLAGFGFASLEKGKDAEYLHCDHNTRLNRFRFRNGAFGRPRTVALPLVPAERFGCPDYNEFLVPYNQPLFFDFDGDGNDDLLLNSEHHWRFGGLGYFRNLGNGTFAPEQTAVPLRWHYLKFVSGADGKSELAVEPETPLDFLSLPTGGVLDPAAGKIVFDFTPGATPPAEGAALLSSLYPARISYPKLKQCRSAADYLALLPKGFALWRSGDGRIGLKLDAETLFAAAPELAPGKTGRFELAWSASGTVLTLDGRELLRSAAKPGFAGRLHLGSLAIPYIQFSREYAERCKNYPADYSLPACGSFRSLELCDGSGKVRKAFDFTSGDAGEFADRCASGYRCLPGAVENYKGTPALIVPSDSITRRHRPAGAPLSARLYAVPFTRKAGSPPSFGKAEPLLLADGTPFECYERTQILPCDWNHDGAVDLLLCSDNTGFKPRFNIGVELFLNDGNWRFTRAEDREIANLNRLINAHHEVRIAFASLTGAAEPDLLVTTDSGARIFRREYLRRPEIAAAKETGKDE